MSKNKKQLGTMVKTIRCLAIVMVVAILCTSLTSAAARKKGKAKDCREKCDSSSGRSDGSCFKSPDSDELNYQQISKECGQCMGVVYCNAGKCTTKSCDRKKKRRRKKQEGEERLEEDDEDVKKEKKEKKKKKKKEKKKKPSEDSDESDSDSDWDWDWEDFWPCNGRKHDETSSQ